MFDTEKFIDEVQGFPALYDSKHDDYHNKDAKMQMWRKIGAVMYPNWETLSKEEAENRAKELVVKWKSIRDHFIKDLKIFKNENLSRNLSKKRKYVYFDQLTFLLPTVDSRHFKPAGCENENIFRDFEGEALSLESGASNMSVENDGDYKFVRKKRKNDAFEDCNSTQDGYNSVIRSATDVLELEQNLGNDQTNYLPIHQNDIPDRLGNRAFLISLLPFVNKIPDDMGLHFRVEIMQTIQKYLESTKVYFEQTE